MEQPFISIFTPTYNRAHTLPKLYESLCQQTKNSFVWLVIDDGSTDSTESLINEWIDENKIKIVYHKQENGGKQRAHNTAVALCTTEAFHTLDSDDYLINDAIETLSNAWDKIKDMPNVSGIISLWQNLNNKEAPSFPKTISYSPQTELYQKHKFRGETQLTFKTSVLRQFSYDVADGEKFISESYIFQQIDQKYTMLVFNKIVAVGTYLEDGYSQRIAQTIFNNPRSYMRLKKQSMDLAYSKKYKFFNAINLLSAYFIVNQKEKNFKWDLYTITAYFPGLLQYFRRFRKYKK